MGIGRQIIPQKVFMQIALNEAGERILPFKKARTFARSRAAIAVQFAATTGNALEKVMRISTVGNNLRPNGIGLGKIGFRRNGGVIGNQRTRVKISHGLVMEFQNSSISRL